MSKISKSGITVGQIIRAEHLLRIIDALSGEVPATQLEISGSVTASFFVGNGSQLTNLPTGSGGGTPGGSNTQIQFNSGSTFSGSANFRYNYANQSLAQGENVTSSGSYSHAEGYNTQALGIYSHAEGDSTQAIGEGSHAEGVGTQAIGEYSHAEGDSTKTGTQNAYYAESVVSGVVTLSGSYGDVAGEFAADSRLYLYDRPFDNNYNRRVEIISQSSWNGTNTIIELYETSITTTTAYVGDIDYEINNWTGDQTIPGNYAHTEGYGTITVGEYSHAEGQSTQAIGDESHAEGSETKAIGQYSHTEGSQTRTIGAYSHAEGSETQTIGEYSHAEGLGTITSGSYQHVQGQFNIPSTSESAFIIGNGTSDGSRSNLVFASGSQVAITGSLSVTGLLRTNEINNTGTSGLIIAGNTNLTLRESNANVENGVIIGTTSLNNEAYTNRTTNFVTLRRGWSAISGSSNLTTNALHVSNSINYVSSSGDNIARGLFVNPTLTGVSDYRAIQTTTGSVIFNGNTTVTGSLTVKDIIQLERRTTTPTPAEGMIIASGSAGASVLYYYNGTTWNALF
jgi:hypothetical protein